MSDWERYNDQFRETEDERNERLATKRRARAADLRDPDPTREGIFRTHNCWKCLDGKVPCAAGNAATCRYPHARND